jgi:putative spermidine/putrescine transport system permease protein
MILFSRGGMLDIIGRRLFASEPFSLIYAEPAVIIGIIAINLPFTVLILQSVLEGIDPRLEEAAAAMGAAPSRAFSSRAFWRIVFPPALPGTPIAAVLCYILCMNAYAAPVLPGGPHLRMMTPLLDRAFSGDSTWPFAAAIAFILMGTTLLLTGLANMAIPCRYRPAGPMRRSAGSRLRNGPEPGAAFGPDISPGKIRQEHRTELPGGALPDAGA